MDILEFEFDKDKNSRLKPERANSTQPDLKHIPFPNAVRLQSKSKHAKVFALTGYDVNLVRHIDRHGGWNNLTKEAWVERGFRIRSAEKRLTRLQQHRIISKSFQPTKQYVTELEKYRKRVNSRNVSRGSILRATKDKEIARLVGSLSGPEKVGMIALSQFRQMTGSQLSKLQMNELSIKSLERQGLLVKNKFLVNGKPKTFFALSSSHPRKAGLSGAEVTKKGLGIAKPLSGFQRDQSKLSHDLAVFDAVWHAKDKYMDRGFEVVGFFTEHVAYQSKTSASSDQGSAYADAYLELRNSDGEGSTIAIEFGNYRPSYLKDKLEKLDADEICVYTNEDQKVPAYEKIAEELPEKVIHIENLNSINNREMER